MRILLYALVLIFPNAIAQTGQHEGVGVQKSRLRRIARELIPHAARFNKGAGSGQPPQFPSTLPSNENRIREIEANLPKVLPLYRKPS